MKMREEIDALSPWALTRSKWLIAPRHGLFARCDPESSDQWAALYARSGGMVYGGMGPAIFIAVA